MGRRTKALTAAVLGGAAALLLAGVAWAHPGGGLADPAEVLARALGVTAAEVEQAKEDGTLKAMLDGVDRVVLAAAYADARDAAFEALDGIAALRDLGAATRYFGAARG